MIHCRFEDDKETNGLRHTVSDIVCLDGGQVLLVHRAEHLVVEGGKWALPGGFMDRDETLSVCARRELLEETGYLSANLRLFNLETRPDRGDGDDRQTVTGVFLCEPGERVQEPDAESSEVKWFPVARLADAIELAFDHQRIIDQVEEYLLRPFALPLMDGEALGTE